MADAEDRERHGPHHAQHLDREEIGPDQAGHETAHLGPWIERDDLAIGKEERDAAISRNRLLADR